jgi:hypothetical protein
VPRNADDSRPEYAADDPFRLPALTGLVADIGAALPDAGATIAESEVILQLSAMYFDTAERS